VSKRTLCALLMLGALVDAWLVLGVLGLGPRPLDVYDYVKYHVMAVNLLDQHVFSLADAPPYPSTLFRAPGYPAFIAGVYAIAGRSVYAVRIAQFLLLGLSSIFLYLLACRIFPGRVAFAAAAVAVVHPSFVFMATTYNAHLVTLALAGGLFLAVHVWSRQDRPSAAGWIVVGGLVAVMTYVRPAFQGLGILMAIAILFLQRSWTMGQRLGAALALCLGMGVCVSPWLLRNNRISAGQSGTRMMVGGWALWHSALQYNGKISYKTLQPEWERLITDFNGRNADAEARLPGDVGADPTLLARRELEVERTYAKLAAAEASQVRATSLPGNLVRRVGWLWSTSDQSPWSSGGTFHRIQQCLHVLFLATTALGVWCERRRLADQWVLWILAVYQTSLSLVFHVEPRFTFESRLLLLPYAVLGVLFAARAGGRPGAQPEARRIAPA
jgi:4-amino-4-deoxy-L-arabinose transferase-like glycosyltransferase